SAPNPTAVGLVRSYKLTYANDRSISARSLMTQVQECDGAGVCKPATTFDWEHGDDRFIDTDTGLTDVKPDGSFYQTPSLVTADLDGDGRDDLLYRTSGTRWSYRRSNPLDN